MTDPKCNHERAAERLAATTPLDAASAKGLIDALAAMGGQLPTAEDIEYAIDGGIPDDLPGYREVYTQRAAARVLALLTLGDADQARIVL